jgi:hypothetical protein
MQDRTDDGKRFRVLTVIDEFTRRSLAIVVARRVGSYGVLHCLTDLFVPTDRPSRFGLTMRLSLWLATGTSGLAGSASGRSSSSSFGTTKIRFR